MVLPRFARAALRGEALGIHGDGMQTRCFADVREVARALVDLAACPAAVGEIVNVGSTEEISIAELAALVVELAGTAAPLRYVEPSSVYGEGFEDLRRRVPDLAKLERLIGWYPRRKLRAIAEDVVQELRQAESGSRGAARERRAANASQEPSPGSA
jgi:UDP-glucose 4-epimerase